MGVAGIIELAGGAFITLGLFTRMARSSCLARWHLLI